MHVRFLCLFLSAWAGAPSLSIKKHCIYCKCIIHELVGFLAPDKNNTWPTCCCSCSGFHISENPSVDTANCIRGTRHDCWLNVIKFPSSAMKGFFFFTLSSTHLVRKSGERRLFVCVKHACFTSIYREQQRGQCSWFLIPSIPYWGKS